VKRLLQEPTNRVDPSANNNFAFVLASEKCHTEITDLLLQDRVRRNKRHTEIINLLIHDRLVRVFEPPFLEQNRHKTKRSICSTIYNWCKNLTHKQS
jgi:hypothetical protein